MLNANDNVTLTNFAIERILTIGEPLTQYNMVFFMAPEVIDSCYIDKSDTWSCGCLLYLMLSGYLPFQGSFKVEVLQQIIQLKKVDFGFEEFKSVSQDCKSFISELLTHRKKRLSAREAL